jgi:heme A synthase
MAARLWNQEVMLAGVLIGQTGLGILNVILVAPAWLQIVHLLVAELFWVLVVLASANLLFATVDRSSDARMAVDSKATPSMALRSDFVVKS